MRSPPTYDEPGPHLLATDTHWSLQESHGTLGDPTHPISTPRSTAQTTQPNEHPQPTDTSPGTAHLLSEARDGAQLPAIVAAEDGFGEIGDGHSTLHHPTPHVIHYTQTNTHPVNTRTNHQTHSAGRTLTPTAHDGPTATIRPAQTTPPRLTTPTRDARLNDEPPHAGPSSGTILRLNRPNLLLTPTGEDPPSPPAIQTSSVTADPTDDPTAAPTPRPCDRLDRPPTVRPLPRALPPN
ncbi:hypothetical protein BDW22DRAFT_1426282 [Trametopsis cervina]|nr:hypothetical protein BDW22DRAFT_1426282 [Trametopsis cervina]